MVSNGGTYFYLTELLKPLKTLKGFLSFSLSLLSIPLGSPSSYLAYIHMSKRLTKGQREERNRQLALLAQAREIGRRRRKEAQDALSEFL